MRSLSIFTRRQSAALSSLAVLYLLVVPVAAQEEPSFNFSPPDDQPRGTLFQWSYGTSFEGGPKRDEPIVTDRPDFTEASVTVGKGVVQIETGYTFSYDGDTALRAHSYPETLFRVGLLAEWFELRLSYNHTREAGIEGGAGSIVQHSGDHLYLGAKLALTPQEGLLPEMAIVPQMIRTSGNNGRFLPGVNWLYGWDITERISTGGSSQLNQDIDADSGELYVEFAQSWTIGYSLTERLGMYTEWFCLTPSGADTSQTQHYLDGGFTYLVTDDWQLDIRAGMGLSHASEDLFCGAGMSLRF